MHMILKAIRHLTAKNYQNSSMQSVPKLAHFLDTGAHRTESATGKVQCAFD